MVVTETGRDVLSQTDEGADHRGIRVLTPPTAAQERRTRRPIPGAMELRSRTRLKLRRAAMTAALGALVVPATAGAATKTAGDHQGHAARA